jgi:hypothetical protein
MKRKCKFRLFGQIWECIRTTRVKGLKKLGGCMDSDARTIYVNSSYDEENFLDYLHHELYEAAALLNGCVYDKSYPDEKSMYIMDHTQMDVISSEVRGAYEDIKKNLGVSFITSEQ